MKKTYSRRSRIGIVAGVLLASILTVGGFALTNALTVPTATHAGDGTAPIETLAASNIHYSLNPTTGNNIDSVDFDLDIAVIAGGTAAIQADSTGGAWYACVTTGTVNGIAATTTHPVCDTTVGTQLVALDVDQMRIVVAD